jgi:N-glycosylase/DNA lyase
MLVDAHGLSIDPSDHVEPAEKWLKALRELKIADAREELLKFMGVGRKVADCVLLMSLDKVRSSPFTGDPRG